MAFNTESAIKVLRTKPGLEIGRVSPHNEPYLAAGFEVRGRPVEPLYTPDELNDFMRSLLADFPKGMDAKIERDYSYTTFGYETAKALAGADRDTVRMHANTLNIGSMIIGHLIPTAIDSLIPRGVQTRLTVYPDEDHLAAALRVPLVNGYHIPMDNGELLVS